jgi:hypothetical protein
LETSRGCLTDSSLIELLKLGAKCVGDAVTEDVLDMLIGVTSNSHREKLTFTLNVVDAKCFDPAILLRAGTGKSANNNRRKTGRFNRLESRCKFKRREL